MKHRWLDWLGLTTMMVVAVALLTGCKGKGGDYDDDEDEDEEVVENVLDCVTDEDLASFNPDMPLSEGGGQSAAFQMHPLEEMSISAPAGAFDVNPDIQVSVASGQQLQAAEERLAELMPDHELLWGYDINAGLPSDSVLPGKYTVKIDLNKLGIPEELHAGISLVRIDDMGHVQQINSRVKKGVIRYEACQNSLLVIVGSAALAVLVPLAIYNGTFALPVRANMKLDAWKAAGYPIGFWNKTDLVDVNVHDDFGYFNVMFRFKMTEAAHRFKEYAEKSERLNKRVHALKQKAVDDYDRDHPFKIAYGDASPATLETIRKRRVERELLYYQLLHDDKEVQSLANDPDVELPQSVQDIIKATKLANRFSRDSLGLNMKPLSYVYNVYMVPTKEVEDSKTQALFVPLPSLGGKILVNYDHFLKNDGSKIVYDRSSNDAMSVTMAHEIGHAFEMEYTNSVFFTNKQFLECIGSVTEHWFAAWLKKKGYLNIADTESKEAMEKLKYAYRDEKQLLAWPLGIDYPKKNLFQMDDPPTHGGYMLGDLVQFLCDNKKKVNFDRIMTKYAYNKSFVQDMKDIFAIKSDSEFAQLYEKFCWKYMKEIVERQDEFCKMKNFSNMVIPVAQLTPDICVKRLSNLGHNGTAQAQPFTLKTILFKIKNTRPYTLFAAPSKMVNKRTLKFTFMEEGSMKQAKDSMRLEPCKKNTIPTDCHGAVFYRPGIEQETLDNDYYIDIVALYQPDKTPEVKGMSNDGTGLIVHTHSKPSKELMQKELITGMQLVVKNNKTGKTRGFGVPLEKCGDEVKVPYDKLGITDKTDVDVTIQSRWYYTVREGKNYFSPATDKVNYKRKGEQEDQNQTQANPAEENDSTDLDESEEDYGGKILVDRKIRIKNIGDKGTRKDAPLYGRLVITKDRFVLTVPSYSWPVNDNTVNVISYPQMPSIEMKGTCDMNFTDPKNFRVKFACSKIKPETITLESKGTFKDRGEPYLDYKCWSGGAKQPKHSELRVVNGHWPTFSLYAVMKLTVKNVWRTKIIDDSTYDNGVFEVCTEDEYDK